MFDLTRRYYYDSLINEYVFLLDNQLGIELAISDLPIASFIRSFTNNKILFF